MSDLRTRIAKAIRPHTDLGNRCTCGWKWPTGCRFDVEQYDLHLADAVILELGLEPERRIGPGEPGEGLSGYIRYVTEWRVDD